MLLDVCTYRRDPDEPAQKKRDPDELADLDAASACGGVTVPYMIGISKDLMKFNPVFQMIM
jgi:hypothetical protein